MVWIFELASSLGGKKAQSRKPKARSRTSLRRGARAIRTTMRGGGIVASPRLCAADTGRPSRPAAIDRTCPKAPHASPSCLRRNHIYSTRGYGHTPLKCDYTLCWSRISVHPFFCTRICVFVRARSTIKMEFRIARAAHARRQNASLDSLNTD